MSWTFGRWAPGWAAAVLLVVAAAVGFDVVLLAGLGGDLAGDARHQLLTFPFTAVPYALAGALLMVRRPDLPFGWLLGGAALGLSATVVGVSSANLAARAGHTGGWVVALLALSVFGFLLIAVQGLVNVRFPSGRPAGVFGRWLERLLVAGTVAVMVGGVLGGDPADLLGLGAPPVRNPLAGTRLGETASAAMVLAPVVVLLGLVAGLGVVVRWRRARGVERQQLVWRAWGVIASLVLFVPAVVGELAWADYADSVVFVATLVIPVLRYRLWGVGTVVRRSTAYAATSVLLVLAFAAVTVLATALVSRQAWARSSGPDLAPESRCRGSCEGDPMIATERGECPTLTLEATITANRGAACGRGWRPTSRHRPSIQDHGFMIFRFNCSTLDVFVFGGWSSGTELAMKYLGSADARRTVTQILHDRNDAALIVEGQVFGLRSGDPRKVRVENLSA